jgi:hypothetical protein
MSRDYVPSTVDSARFEAVECWVSHESTVILLLASNMGKVGTKNVATAMPSRPPTFR